MKKAIFGLLLFGLFAGQSALAKDWSVVISLQPNSNPEFLRAERKLVEKYFSEKVALPAKIIVPLTYAAVQQGLRNGTIDLALVNGLEMHRANLNKSALPLFVVEKDGSTFYQGHWIALKSKKYLTIKDLKDKPVVFESRNSVAGFLFPVMDLVSRKLLAPRAKSEDYFGEGNVSFASNSEEALSKVLAGGAEVTAMAEDTFRQSSLSASQKELLQPISTVGPIPRDFLAISRGMHAADRARLKKGILGISPRIRDQLFGGKLVKGELSQLVPLQKALEETGLLLEKSSIGGALP